MAAAESVGAAEGNDLAVIKAHAAKDRAEVRLLFSTIRQTAIGGAHADIAIGTAGAPRDNGALNP